MTICEIIRVAPSSKDVFRKYGLDQIHVYQLEFEDACARCDVSPHLVKSELVDIHTAEKRMTETLNQVVQNILSLHSIVKAIVSDIRAVLPIAIASEEVYQDELLITKTKFQMLQEQLEMHLYTEEMVLFPEFIGLWNKKNGNHYAPSFFLAYPVESLESEHESVKLILSDIRQLSRHRTLQNASEPYQQVCKHLDVLEKKLNDLIHLESNLLFPEALALEKDFYDDATRK